MPAFTKATTLIATRNPCPQPEGACCAPDGTCTVTAEADCDGLYEGDGTDCSPNPVRAVLPRGHDPH